MSASTPSDPPAAGQPPPTTGPAPSTDDGARTLAADIRPLPAAEVLPAAGRFRVLRPHARGGLGEVFVARDEELNRDVALKRIRPQHAHQLSSRRRFLTEAELTARLEHPGVVPVHGLVRDGRRPAVLRHALHRRRDAVRGDRALSRSRLAGGFPRPGVPPALAALRAGLQHPRLRHSRGVVHRDLKPANVMLGRSAKPSSSIGDWPRTQESGVRSQESVKTGLLFR